ncbi:MAG: aminotransferase class V-fold PLP-dependent enzyme [Pseudomonadota bacterium]
MSLRFGPTTLAIPGPSIVPERVLRAMHRASPNIYEGELVDMMDGLTADLKRVARTAHEVAIYIGNGHAAWEAALSNVFSPGDKALVLVTGRFALGWADMAKAMGVDVELMDFGTAAPVDPQQVEDRLRADTAGELKAVLTVHTDTASSVRNDIPAIRAAMDQAGHSGLLMVDCIASLACEPFEMDAWGVDVMVAGCQKGLMTPAGVSFTFHGPKAAEAAKTAECRTSYWNWDPRTDPDLFYQRFAGTAPTHHLYGLREALTMLLEEEGLEACWARHQHFAETLWAATDHWAEGQALACNIRDRAHRSIAVTTLRIEGCAASEVRAWCEAAAGLTLGIGLGLDAAGTPPSDGIFRIGHMGHLSAHNFLGTIATVDAALKALEVPHGEGAVAAATMEIARRAAA